MARKNFLERQMLASFSNFLSFLLLSGVRVGFLDFLDLHTVMYASENSMKFVMETKSGLRTRLFSLMTATYF